MVPVALWYRCSRCLDESLKYGSATTSEKKLSKYKTVDMQVRVVNARLKPRSQSSRQSVPLNGLASEKLFM